jgi:hypothetical protein
MSGHEFDGRYTRIEKRTFERLVIAADNHFARTVRYVDDNDDPESRIFRWLDELEKARTGPFPTAEPGDLLVKMQRGEFWTFNVTAGASSRPSPASTLSGRRWKARPSPAAPVDELDVDAEPEIVIFVPMGALGSIGHTLPSWLAYREYQPGVGIDGPLVIRRDPPAEELFVDDAVSDWIGPILDEGGYAKRHKFASLPNDQSGMKAPLTGMGGGQVSGADEKVRIAHTIAENLRSRAEERAAGAEEWLAGAGYRPRDVDNAVPVGTRRTATGDPRRARRGGRHHP